MKRIILLLLSVAILLSLSGCFSSRDDWKEEFGTPELYFEGVNGSHFESVHLYESEGQFTDEDLKLKDAILAAGPFEAIPEREPTTDRYFTYQGFWQPATSGPNYCNLSIWDDGLIVIHHKYSLGAHGYLYFQMDPAKAKELNDMVFQMYGTEETQDPS